MKETTDEGAGEKAMLAETETDSREIGALIDCYSGCLDTSSDLHKRTAELRNEWR